MLRSNDSLTPQLTMLRGLVANGKSLKKNFCLKIIAKCKNLKEVSKRHQLSSLLSKFNGKPHLLAASVKPFESESNVLEITCDMRTWGYLAKSRAVANYSILPDAVIQAGLTIEGRSDCELPEQLLGCFELRFADLSAKGDAVRRV